MSRIHRHRPLPYGKEGNQPARIIIHAMGERILDPEPIDAADFLAKIHLSAHVLIGPGGVNTRCRNDNQTAWHARGYNDDSLGLEFLVPGDHNYGSFLGAIRHPYLDSAMYAEGLYQVREWMNLYSIEEVVRHSDISPGRKVDPGDGFPWEDFKHDLGI